MGSSITVTVTTTALLEALRNGQDVAAWEEFDRRYRPVIFRLAIRMGLEEADAADVAQESLLAFFRDHCAGRYQRGRGRLRSWLLGIARHRALDALERRRRSMTTGGISVLESLELPGESALEALWEAELQEEILRRAFELLGRTRGVDARTLCIFEEYGLRGLGVEEVAHRHGVTPSTVYAIKSRCLKHLTDIRAELQLAYEEL